MTMPIIDSNVPIRSYLDGVEEWANTSFLAAGAFADKLTAFTAPLFTPNVTFTSTTSNVGLNIPTAPAAPSISLGTKTLPSSPSISLPTVSIGTGPAFTDADPVISFPSVPNPLNISAPVKDFIIDTTLDFPVAPNTALPSVPTLLSLNIPTPEAVALPIFDQVFPTSTLVIPGITFTFSESAYTDSLLTKVKDELLKRLSGGTGLSPAVEAAIWNRGRDRETQAALLAERTLLVDRASSGFSRPSGSTLSALDNIVQETQGKIISLSRDIMIKQAELEQENIKTSIQQTIALEDILIREHNNISQRAFEVAKYTQDIAVEIFKIAVNKYNSEVEAYKAFSVAYTARVQAELSKIEVFKAQIDAEKLKGDINEQSIKIYVATLEGVKSNVEIYKSMIGAVSEKLKAESLKIEVYKTDIEAYSTQVKAKAEEYSMYSEQIKGELAKVSVFESKVKAFASKVQAYAASSDVSLKKADTEIAVSGLQVKKYEADIQAFIDQVKADQAIYDSAVSLYKGQAEMYIAQVGANKAASELALKNSENVITQNKYKADIGIENAKVYLQSLQMSYSSTLEAQKAAGSIYSQLAASSMSALNVSASVSSGFSNSSSNSYSESVSL